jgi:hypothetical protein
MNEYSWLARQVKKNIRALDSGRILLWSHLGLGDQISASPIVEQLLNRKIEVVWPVKPRNLNFMNHAFNDWGGLSIVRLNESLREDFQIRKIAFETKSSVVSLGHGQLSSMRTLFPEFSLNSLFNLFIGLDPLNLVSQSMRDSLLKLDQEEPPLEPYAFLDHHPGTAREIPSQALSDIKERGLRLIENPRDLPLFSTVRLLDSAQELHMVNSAPLCLALTTDAKASVRIHYDTHGDPVSKSYERWKTKNLGSTITDDSKERSISRAAEDARLEILSMQS